MRLDTLLEKHYRGPVYHITTVDAMKAILISNHFQLTNAKENYNEKNLVFNNNFPYFFSVSRSRISAVRDQHGGSSGTFVLDMDKLANPKTTIVKPLNWHNPKGTSKLSYRSLESEERIWSSQPTLSLDAVLEVHIYYSKIHSGEALKNTILDISEICDKRGIKFFVYKNERSYLLLNKKKTVTKLSRTDDSFYNENVEEQKKLLEKHYTGPFYHSTKLGNGVNILEKNRFELTSYYHDEDFVSFDQMKGYEYFMSVSRSKMNSFKENTEMTFVLDSRYFMKKGFKIRPVDYFGQEIMSAGHDVELNNILSGGRRGESEERIWSKSEVIPADSILQAHINLKDCVLNRLRYHDDKKKAGRVVLEWVNIIMSKTKTFVYPSDSSYHMLDTKRALDHNEIPVFIKKLIKEQSRINV